jgi:alkanesulfonate monooxygenase SsuD/methylene tetrahydromethanopterin reductase-like flavin-dependent oxidoreductase (luciferase family)
MASIEALSQRFTTIWVEDHFQWEDQPTLEAWSTTAYLAAQYPRFQYANLVLGQSYRNPAMLAKMAATLQYLTGGRFILGLGAGWKEDEYRAYGYPYPSARVRIGQLADAIEIARAMWTHSPATYQGEYYAIENAYCIPQPDPLIPIHIGGMGEHGTLRVVARYADAWNFHQKPPVLFRHKLDVLRTYCQEIGRSFDEIKLTYYPTVDLPDDPARFDPESDGYVCGPTPQDAVAMLRPFLELGVTHIMIRSANIASLKRFDAEVTPELLQIAAGLPERGA